MEHLTTAEQIELALVNARSALLAAQELADKLEPEASFTLGAALCGASRSLSGAEREIDLIVKETMQLQAQLQAA